MLLRCVVIDDEPSALELIKKYVGKIPFLKLVHTLVDPSKAMNFLKDIDLVFIDINLPSSIELLSSMTIKPMMIFITAYKKYALQGFEIGAIDYLLKPVTEERFHQALTRAKARLRLRPSDDANRQIIGLLETIVSPRRQMKRLAVRSAGKTVFVDVEEIDWVEAAENYVQLHCGQAVHLLRVPMNTLEKSLDQETFLRIHRSTIVNVGRIKDLQPGLHGEYVLTLRSGVRLQSGRTYQGKLRTLAANPF